LIYDTTLRDGTQAEKISFSKSDKLRIVQMLDDFGVAYIEGGLPGSNPRDAEFFESAKSLCLKHAKLSAFGSTCRAGLSPENDESIGALLRAETPVVTIFGKAWMLHVKDVLRVSCDENLRMIYDSCRYLRQKSREVVFDAEHFFDGYAENPEYSMQVIKTVIDAGVSVITLCDTNGGMLPAEISDICQKVRQIVPENIMLGIHCHNDSDMAVAGSIVAVQAGVQVVQGTINGIGER